MLALGAGQPHIFEEIWIGRIDNLPEFIKEDLP
jgi:hypothetical protein